MQHQNHPQGNFCRVNWSNLGQFLTSLRLTLGLLLGIALVSAGGTINRPEDGRYDLFFQNPLFRFLLVLLAVNLAACTLKTIRRNLDDRQRFLAALAPPVEGGFPLGAGGAASAGERLRAQGYRVEEHHGRLLGSRNRLGRWGSTIVHLSCLVIMAGALSAGFGFVGTLNLLTGDKSAVYYDWKSQSDRPLGFEFRLDHFEPVYYPIELQFATIDPATGRELATYQAREGETVLLSDGLTVKVIRYFFYEEDLVLDLYRDGLPLGTYHALGGTRNWEKNPVTPFLLKPVAFREPVVAQLRSEVSILKGGQVVRRGVIRVNEPLSFEGITIYQTVYSRDKFGFWSAGFQFSRDPGEPVVWFGCIAMLIGLALAFAIPYRVVGVVDGRLLPLTGFRGESGEAALRKLQRALQGID